MKKIHIFGLALLMAMAGACKKNQNQDTSTFSASIEIDESNRTYLDGMKVRWSAGDPIIVYGNGDSQTYTLSQGAGDQTATFTTTGGVQPANTYHAFYPSTSCTGVSGDVFTFTMPATQTYTANGFMNNLNPMAGKNDGNGGTLIGFKNAFAVAKFSTKGNRNVGRIELEVPSGNYVSGTFTFNYANGTTTYSSGGTQVITLNCANPVALNSTTEEDFYFVLPPGSIDNGFTIRYYQPNSNTPFATKTVAAGTQGIALVRNTIKTFHTTAEAADPTVTNLLPALSGADWSLSGFTNGQNGTCWNGAQLKAKINNTSGKKTCTTINTVSIINGHQYYVRWRTLTHVNGGVNVSAQSIEWPLGTAFTNDYTVNSQWNWQTNSQIVTATQATGNYTYSIVYKPNGKPLYDGTQYHHHMETPMLIDLTATYTDNGEAMPSKSELDAKPYFTGTQLLSNW